MPIVSMRLYRVRRLPECAKPASAERLRAETRRVARARFRGTVGAMSDQPEPQPSGAREVETAVPAVPDAPAATEPATATAEPRSYAPLFMKGCGWTLLSIVLGVGVVVAGKGDFESVGSGLAGIFILLLVLSSSGLTGFWSNKS